MDLMTRKYVDYTIEEAFGALNAASTPLADSGGYFTSTNTEGALQEVGSQLAEKENSAAVMRKLISRTIAAGENVAAITWTQDDAGNALALEEAEIVADFPANSLAVGATAGTPVRINGINTGYEGASATAAEYAYLRTTYCHASERIFKNGGILRFDAVLQSFDGTTTQRLAPMSSLPGFGATTKIQSIYMSINGLTYFPAGTVITIRGRTE